MKSFWKALGFSNSSNNSGISSASNSAVNSNNSSSASGHNDHPHSGRPPLPSALSLSDNNVNARSGYGVSSSNQSNAGNYSSFGELSLLDVYVYMYVSM